jgi:phosphoglycerate dehydrogenase-like enzyme
LTEFNPTLVIFERSWVLDNVVFSPHSAGSNLTSEAAVANRCLESILAVSRGERPGEDYLLNPEVLLPGRGRLLAHQAERHAYPHGNG